MTWHYFKVYCGETIADQVLATHVGPLAQALVQDGTAERWFFIRYVDPHHHLRVRFLAGDDAGTPLRRALEERLECAIADDLVWKIEAAVYEPELERYGRSTMALAERLFHADSVLVAGAVAAVRESGDEHLRWQFGLAAIDRRLTDFGYDAPQQSALLDRLAHALLPEFGESGRVRERIDRRARDLRRAREAALEPQRQAECLGPLWPLMDIHSQATREDRETLRHLSGSGRLEVAMDHLLASYLHMFCNRLFPTRQRLHELVLYLFLARHARAHVARRAGV
jgi:thiopeptide-type bacteriocin biosynthesis protein